MAVPPLLPALAAPSGAPQLCGRMTSIEELSKSGYRRLGAPGKGFRFLDPRGRPAAQAEVSRIRQLKLPPAWSDVFVSRKAGAKLQAVGRDKAGRWQYRYHPAFRKRQEKRKFERLLRFAAALPRVRAAVARDLRRRGLPREKVLAAAVHILATCFMRAGSKVYAEANRSYGLATLRRRDVSVEGDLVRFDYVGKSGKRQVRELRDGRIAQIVKALLRLPTRELLAYVGEDGAVVDVRRRHINAYIKTIMGEAFTSKDFRTWAGTLLCACELARGAASMVPGRTDRQRMARAAVKATAALLGNTPAVCKSSYIFPGVLAGFSQGRVIDRWLDDVSELNRQRGLHRCEEALVAFLQATGGRAKARPPARGARQGGHAPSKSLRRLLEASVAEAGASGARAASAR